MAPHPGQGMEHLRADRGLGAFQGLGDLGVLHAVPQPQHEHGPSASAARSPRPGPPGSAVSELMAASTGEGSWVVGGSSQSDRGSGRPGSLAKLGTALVGGDPEEPGPERSRILIPASVLPDGQKRLLEQFLGTMPVAGHATDEGQQRAGVASQAAGPSPHGCPQPRATSIPHPSCGRSSLSTSPLALLVICARARICCKEFLGRSHFSELLSAPGTNTL